MAFASDWPPPFQLCHPQRHNWNPTTAKEFFSSPWATTVSRPAVDFPPTTYHHASHFGHYPALLKDECAVLFILIGLPFSSRRIQHYLIFKCASFQAADFPGFCLHKVALLDLYPTSFISSRCPYFPLCSYVISVPTLNFHTVASPFSTAFLESSSIKWL